LLVILPKVARARDRRSNLGVLECFAFTSTSIRP